MVALTDKEARVLKAFLRGVPTPAIATLCGVTTSTVCGYLNDTCRKFGLKDRSELHDKLEYTVKPPKRWLN